MGICSCYSEVKSNFTFFINDGPRCHGHINAHTSDDVVLGQIELGTLEIFVLLEFHSIEGLAVGFFVKLFHWEVILVFV